MVPLDSDVQIFLVPPKVPGLTRNDSARPVPQETVILYLWLLVTSRESYRSRSILSQAAMFLPQVEEAVKKQNWLELWATLSRVIPIFVLNVRGDEFSLYDLNN